jgi:hypothetical protein
MKQTTMLDDEQGRPSYPWDDPDHPLSMSQAAEYTGLSRSCLMRWKNNGFMGNPDWKLRTVAPHRTTRRHIDEFIRLYDPRAGAKVARTKAERASRDGGLELEAELPDDLRVQVAMEPQPEPKPEAQPAAKLSAVGGYVAKGLQQSRFLAQANAATIGDHRKLRVLLRVWEDGQVDFDTDFAPGDDAAAMLTAAAASAAVAAAQNAGVWP